MRARVVFAIIPALVVMTGCEFEDIGDFGHYNEDFHYNYPLKSGGRVSVESFNGGVEISPWDQETVDISGTKTARSESALSEIKIDVDHSPDSVSIRATRPTVRNGNYGARFVIKVPRSVVLDRVNTSNGGVRISDVVGPARVHTSNGGVHINGLKGDLHAETSNGTVELTRVEGPVIARTSNGAIRGSGLRDSVDVDTSNGGIDLSFDSGTVPSIKADTSNSSITLRLPSQANARLSASTSNGSITSDFDMSTRGEMSKHHIEATIGSGGPLIELHTSNGGIRILR